MHVILASIGTDGDIIPYAGLGVELRSRGHRVTLAASADYESLAVARGLEFSALVSAEENAELFGHPDFWNPLKTPALSARWGVRFIRRQYDLLSKLATEDTVLVSSPAIFAATLVHEKGGLPLVNLILQPWLILSSAAPPVVPMFEFLQWAPRPAWKLFSAAMNAFGDVVVGRELNRVRASLGLKPIRRVFENWFSPQLILGMFPDWYGPPQEDWPAQVRLTGFPLFDGGRDDEELPTGLLEFCRAGDPPIAFTFGTGMAHPGVLFRAAVEACELLGVRGVFLTKYNEELPNPLPASVFHCAYAPFLKLFPHCAAVVHHGGIGTVAKAMATGTPQLICPICFDQIDNGVRVKRLGAGDWIKLKNGDGRRIAQTLSNLLTSAIRSRCREIAARFENSDALASAAQWVEQCAAGAASSETRA